MIPENDSSFDENSLIFQNSRISLFLDILDASWIIGSFVIPLLLFPEKSYFQLQLQIGFFNAFLVFMASKTHRLIGYRRLLPLIVLTYGPILGLIYSFIFLGTISFFHQEYLYSRLINLLGFGLSVSYIFLSRRLLLGHLEIMTEKIDPHSIQPTTVQATLRVTTWKKNQDNDSRLLSLDQPLNSLSPNECLYLGLDSDSYDLLFSTLTVLDNHPVLLIRGGKLNSKIEKPKQSLKRIFDLVFAFLILVPTLTLGILIFIFSFFYHLSNPLFIQDRVGYRGKTFKMLKFRTFFGKQNQVSKLGRILRRLNLDEIPQLLNVFKGEMSFVGPRAEIVGKLEKISSSAKIRDHVLPGITGYWQLGPFRSDPIKSHIEYDIFYVLTHSVLVDLIIILLTPLYGFTNNQKK